MTKSLTLKNIILLSTVILSQIHTVFYGLKIRVDWYLLIEHTRRIDYAVMHLTTSLNFMILSYCLWRPKGVLNDVKLFIFITCVLDMIHYLLVSKLYFGQAKIVIAIVIFYLIKGIVKYNGISKAVL